MKKFVLFCFVILLSHLAYSQSCVMNEEAKRYYNRGVTATQIAKNADDYKNALAEYQKAAELCPDCAELYYRMGLCCEIIGEDDNSYYSSALKYFKKSLTAENNISQELKDLIQGKIDGMEYAVEQAAAANKDALIPENLCGRWTFHESNGKTNEIYDIIISENQGFYSVKYRMFEQYDIGEDGLMPNNPISRIMFDGDINFKDNVICFHTKYVRSDWYKPQHREIKSIIGHFDYELTLKDGVLKGVRTSTREFMGTGHSDYSSVTRAVKAGHGHVIYDSSGRTSNVYFTR